MLFSQINPYIRYARYLNLDNNAHFEDVIPLDARLFYSIRGYGKIKVESTVYEMMPHSLLIINSGIPYQILPPDISVNYISINFDFTWSASSVSMPVNPVLKADFKKEMLLDFNTFDDAKILSTVLYVENIDIIQKKLTSITQEYLQKLLYYEHKCSHLLAECLTDTLRFKKIGNHTLESEVSNRVLSYIQDNYKENITNQSIGKTFGYHPNHISYLIKHLTGMPIHQYIIHVRLINAINLLENSSLSISEIAYACGFCDAAYFSGYFKKYFGISPSKYRKV